VAIPLVVEDGTGLPTANTYVSLVTASEYNMARTPNRTVWDANLLELDVALIDARIRLDSMFDWRGQIKTFEQALAWPRTGVVDDDGRQIPDDAVPTAIAEAQAQLAYRLLSSRSTAATGGAAGPEVASSERLGDWAITYRAEVAVADWSEISGMVSGLAERGPTSSGFGQQKFVRWS
jgi:hypothetical protein